MKSKWLIDLPVFSNYRIGENGKLYRLPYIKGIRTYSVREIKLQDGRRWKINGDWWSQRQVSSHLILDPNPIVLYKEKEEDLPKWL